MANLPLAFAELLGGGVLVTAGVSGSSIPDVFAGAVSLKPFDATEVGLRTRNLLQTRHLFKEVTRKTGSFPPIKRSP